MVTSRHARPRMVTKVAPGVSKAEANYVSQAMGEERCGRCSMFVMLDSCTKVEGRISPRGHCRLYDPALKDEPGIRSPFASSPNRE